MPSRRWRTPTARTGTCRPIFAAASHDLPTPTFTFWLPTTMPTSSSRVSVSRGGSRTRWGGWRPPSSETRCGHVPKPRQQHQVSTCQATGHHSCLQPFTNRLCCPSLLCLVLILAFLLHDRRSGWRLLRLLCPYVWSEPVIWLVRPPAALTAGKNSALEPNKHTASVWRRLQHVTPFKHTAGKPSTTQYATEANKTATFSASSSLLASCCS